MDWGDAPFGCRIGDGQIPRHAELDQVGSCSSVFDVGHDNGWHDEVPAASPVILLFAEINRRRNGHQSTFVQPDNSCWGYRRRGRALESVTK
jgi:hypothetical protein